MPNVHAIPTAGPEVRRRPRPDTKCVCNFLLEIFINNKPFNIFSTKVVIRFLLLNYNLYYCAFQRVSVITILANTSVHQQTNTAELHQSFSLFFFFGKGSRMHAPHICIFCNVGRKRQMGKSVRFTYKGMLRSMYNYLF